MVRTNTVVLPGGDSSVIRVKGTDKAISMTVNCNSKYCYLDPYWGTAIAVSESARNLAVSGAKPLAVTDCLNFGSPENPAVMWQFKRAIEGMSEDVKKFNTPVVSGNVSFYNETEEKAIYPTPTIGMIGLIENVKNLVNPWFRNEGDLVVLLGETKEELGGSEYLHKIHGKISGTPPELDFAEELKLIDTLLNASERGILNSAHDLSEGGLATALAESCFSPAANIGVRAQIPIDMREDALLFSESQSRAIVTLDEGKLESLREITNDNGLKSQVIGKVGGDRIYIEDLVDISLNEAFSAWDTGFVNILKSYA